MLAANKRNTSCNTLANHMGLKISGHVFDPGMFVVEIRVFSKSTLTGSPCLISCAGYPPTKTDPANGDSQSFRYFAEYEIPLYVQSS